MPALPRSPALAALISSVLVSCLIGAAADAQVAFEANGLSGETSVAGTAKTGNTESTDVGLGLKLRHESERWRHILGGNFDWGRADGENTKNRLAGSYEIARLLNDRLYGFGRGAYAVDEFDGYDYRAILGGGLGVDVLRGKERSWSLQGGPAYRVDEVEPSLDDMGVLLAPAETQTSVALNLGSRFEAQINDAVSFLNESDIASSADTSTFFNSAALTADLMGAISARFSFEVRHDTGAPIGTEQTDTTSRAALVYAFGGD
jgi:putative salt-induced outer membrane protein